MTSQVDFSPCSKTARRAVRLLFLAWFIYFVVGLVVRKKFGEPYPGFFMPSFAGIGLTSMSATEGEMLVGKIVVTFQDQTTAEISLGQFCGEALFPTSLAHQFLSSGHGTVPADVKAYLEARARTLFPQKIPQAVTFRIYRESFPLNHPQSTRIIGLVDQCTVTFSHENAD